MTLAAPEMTRMQAIETARRMHAGGWNIDQIRRYVNDRGDAATWGMVKGWIDEDYAERRRAAERKRQRDRYRRINGPRPEALKIIGEHEKLARALMLRKEGLSFEALAVVLRVDFGDDFTADALRHALRKGRYPRGRRGRPRTKAAA